MWACPHVWMGWILEVSVGNCVHEWVNICACVYVWMWVKMAVCCCEILCDHVCGSKNINVYIYMSEYLGMHMCVHMNICEWKCEHVCVLSMPTCKYESLCLCINEFLCSCMSMLELVSICMNVRMFMCELIHEQVGMCEYINIGVFFLCAIECISQFMNVNMTMYNFKWSCMC